MTTKIDSGKPTPEAQLRSFNDMLGPKQQKFLRSVRAALRKRFPTANELAYDYSSFFVIAYSPTEQGIDAPYRSPHEPMVWICTSIMDRNCPTRRSF